MQNQANKHRTPYWFVMLCGFIICLLFNLTGDGRLKPDNPYLSLGYFFTLLSIFILPTYLRNKNTLKEIITPEAILFLFFFGGGFVFLTLLANDKESSFLLIYICLFLALYRFHCRFLDKDKALNDDEHFVYVSRLYLNRLGLVFCSSLFYTIILGIFFTLLETLRIYLHDLIFDIATTRVLFIGLFAGLCCIPLYLDFQIKKWNFLILFIYVTTIFMVILSVSTILSTVEATGYYGYSYFAMMVIAVGTFLWICLFNYPYTQKHKYIYLIACISTILLLLFLLPKLYAEFFQNRVDYFPNFQCILILLALYGFMLLKVLKPTLQLWKKLTNTVSILCLFFALLPVPISYILPSPHSATVNDKHELKPITQKEKLQKKQDAKQKTKEELLTKLWVKNSTVCSPNHPLWETYKQQWESQVYTDTLQHGEYFVFDLIDINGDEKEDLIVMYSTAEKNILQIYVQKDKDLSYFKTLHMDESIDFNSAQQCKISPQAVKYKNIKIGNQVMELFH
ncbi:hypothetical protein [Basilea psittacipulmonis]|uniref:DUF4153 domain-containing protein n=1 Tax=Basilea psittacipulmonis DSM 24701 TaxID=1072685 RepID=A0A077DCA5_9BURK|nr:hypothetical protein [Basilea psittacipulmonis]AIL32525.1 hypothetical protein IX83_03685 [Basilea psittacipulmonis DSM 24701]